MQYDGYRLTDIEVDNRSSGQYEYDANGNMVYEGYDGSNHGYNILNRLDSICYENSSGGGSMRAIYSSSGEKLAMQTRGDNGGMTTYYRGEFTYVRPDGATEEMLYQVHHPEGIVSKTDQGYTYNYFKTDHLGNVRVLLAAVPIEFSRGSDITFINDPTVHLGFGDFIRQGRQMEVLQVNE